MGIEEKIREVLLKQKLEIIDPLSASQCGYEGLEGYCRRRRILSHLKPQNIEENEELQKVFLKGFYTEFAYKNILRQALKERVYTSVEWKLKQNGITIRVNPDAYIPALHKIIEIKAIKKLPEKPIEMHRIQVGIQIEACPRENITAEIHYIEYEGRKWNMRIFNIDRLKRDELDKIYKENEIVADYYQRREVPPIPSGFSHTRYPCRIGMTRCPYFDDCYVVEKNFTDIVIDDIDNYYKVKKKISDLEKSIERLRTYCKKFEELFPKEKGLYRIGDYTLSVIHIPEQVVKEHIRSAYTKYLIRKIKEKEEV